MLEPVTERKLEDGRIIQEHIVGRCHVCNIPTIVEKRDKPQTASEYKVFYERDFSNYADMCFRLDTGQILRAGVCKKCLEEHKTVAQYAKILKAVKKKYPKDEKVNRIKKFKRVIQISRGEGCNVIRGIATEKLEKTIEND